MKLYIIWSTEYKYSGPICYFTNEDKAKAWKENYDRKSANTGWGGGEAHPELYESDIEIRTVETKD